MLGTKEDFQKFLFELLNPLKNLYTKNCAGIDIGDFGAKYDRTCIKFEAFCRPLWGLVPYWAGHGESSDFAKIYLKGLESGSNPANDEYWGDCSDYDQRFVEMAAIAFGILNAPDKIWNPLSDMAKQNLAAWLNEINHHTLPECNWIFFMVLVNLALDSVGMPCDLDNLERGLDKLDSYYVGDGWSIDGNNNHIDYYNPWAMQYYALLYSVFAAKKDPERAKRYRERASLFGKQFVKWFDANGAALPFGRSLTYRFAQCAFWSACIFAGIEPIPMEQMKGIICRNIEWWKSQKMLGRDGCLTVGYCYPNLIMSENYNGPGSPYWALKTFLLLALPDNHKFWKCNAADLQYKEEIIPLKHADMLMQRFQDGHVTGYAAGVNEPYGYGGFPEKYSKFAYSTRYGFSCARSHQVIHQAATDSMLSFIIDDNVFVRKKSKTYQLFENMMVSQWIPFPGISVTTEIIPTKKGHIRRHRIKSSYECKASDCGFSIPTYRKDFTVSSQNNVCFAKTGQYFCKVTGKGNNAKGFLIEADPNTNLFFTNTVIPSIIYDIKCGETVIETEIIECF